MARDLDAGGPFVSDCLSGNPDPGVAKDPRQSTCSRSARPDCDRMQSRNDDRSCADSVCFTLETEKKDRHRPGRRGPAFMETFTERHCTFQEDAQSAQVLRSDVSLQRIFDAAQEWLPAQLWLCRRGNGSRLQPD